MSTESLTGCVQYGTVAMTIQLSWSPAFASMFLGARYPFHCEHYHWVLMILIQHPDPVSWLLLDELPCWTNTMVATLLDLYTLLVGTSFTSCRSPSVIWLTQICLQVIWYFTKDTISVARRRQTIDCMDLIAYKMNICRLWLPVRTNPPSDRQKTNYQKYTGRNHRTCIICASIPLFLLAIF
jgi:hypothetical protein